MSGRYETGDVELENHGNAIGVGPKRGGIKAKSTLTLQETNRKYGIKLTKDEHHALRFVSRQERRQFLLTKMRSK